MSPEEVGRKFRGGVVLGEERSDPVEVVDYDPAWPERFQQMRHRLLVVLTPVARSVEHVGSTAVPELAAKPIVDIQVTVDDLGAEELYRAPIESLGFGLRYRTDYWRYFRPVPGVPRLFQVHVSQAGSKWEREHLLFRDYLRAHPERAAEYGALKRELAPRYVTDRIGYTDAKAPFIQETLRLAEEWAQSTGWTP